MVTPAGPARRGLGAAYDHCRTVNRRHGVTFYRAARLLPRWKRRHVHALYAFARTADDIVDELPPDLGAGELDRFRRSFRDAVRGAGGAPDDLLLAAVVDTIVRFDIDPAIIERFLASMEMDLTTTAYDTWDDLLGYMDGSAAAIGEMMLPILEPSDPVAATAPARALGLAFQLTNFLRDIDEDLGRGRQYLPQTDLHRFGVDLSARAVTPGFVELMRFEIARCRELYASAEPGIAVLPGRSASCVRAAHRLYGGILDRIEGTGYDVFAGRVAVPATTKLTTVASELARLPVRRRRNRLS